MRLITLFTLVPVPALRHEMREGLRVQRLNRLRIVQGVNHTRWCCWCCNVFLAHWRPASTVHSTLSAIPLLCRPDQTEKREREKWHALTGTDIRTVTAVITIGNEMKEKKFNRSLEPYDSHQYVCKWFIFVKFTFCQICICARKCYKLHGEKKCTGLKGGPWLTRPGRQVSLQFLVLEG